MPEMFLGRQPIFSRDGGVAAYELLYRGNVTTDTSEGMFDGEQATANVLVNTLMHFGLEKVSGGKKLFINSTYAFLTGDMPSLLPPEDIVLEVLEDVVPDERLISACQAWKDKGFTIALDDFLYTPHLQPLVDMADLIKVDITILPEKGGMADQLAQLKAAGFKGRLLAEKVETIAEQEEAMTLGFDLFQGYFFCKPEILKKKTVDSSQAQAMQVMQCILGAENISEIEEVLSRDMSLSYKLLKFINSVGLGIRFKVNSVGHALSLLGLRNIRTWLSIIVLDKAASGKSPELMKQAMLRGRFLELLAEQIGQSARKSDYFILGMFSLLDALLDMPMQKIVDDLCLPDMVESGLLDPDSESGKLPNLIKAIERGEFANLHQFLNAKDMQKANLSSIYMEAISWSEEALV